MRHKRLAVMALGTGASYLSRWAAERSIDQATQRLEARLPDPVVKVAGSLPGDVLRVGGAAVVAGNTAVRAGRGALRLSRGARRAGRGAKSAVSVGRGAVGLISGGRRTFAKRKAEVDALLAGARLDWHRETESERRRLRSDLLRRTRGHEAAIDAQLDQRAFDRPDDPLPVTPPPVPGGRHRSPLRVAPLIERMQRTYRAPVKPWDEPVPRRDR